MSQHPLLRRQLDRAKSAGSSPDLPTLLSLVNGAYQEHDQDRRRVDRANNLMAEELETLNSDLHGAIEALELQNLRFEAALNNMSHGLCLFDRDGRLVVCNRRFLELYGMSAEAAPVGAALAEIIGASPALREASQVARRALVAEHVGLGAGGTASVEQAWPDGRIIHIVRDRVEDGGCIDTIADITESRQASAKIAHMARHDALTDLPNRVLLRERLMEAISSARCGELSAVLYLDLDRFKSVNDSLGHPVGDALLIAVTGRLKAQVRNGDTVARLGGDEFAIIQRQINDADETEVLGRRVIQAVSEPYSLNGHKIHIGASIGIEMIRGMDVDPDEVMRNADVALYKAKSEGRGCFRSFDPELHSVLGKRRLTETNLRRAISDPDAFEIHYQPQFDLSSRSVTGFEALVRWRDPVRGLLPPSEFIAVAEETGLIDTIGQFVLDRACRDALAWPEHICVAVNLSAVQFKTSRVGDVVKAALERTGLSPRRIDLEITETVMLEDDQHAIRTLSHLQSLGARISLDDFGTGYSSLSFLRRFPFNRIKIDQSFVRDMADNPGSVAIIRAVISICRSMGIDSIAEGIETAEQLAWLAEEGCDSAQGFLLGRPMKLAAATALVATRARPRLRAVVG